MAPKLRDISTISAFSILLSKDAEYTRVCGSSNSENNSNNSILGMDSHADVSCAGRDAHISSRVLGRVCEVKGFHDSYNTISNVSYVNVLYKYEDKHGQEYLLEMNRALDFTETMTNSILCTNQARHNGVMVNDIPRIIDQNSPQCITFPESNIHLPLQMRGPVPILPISKPNDLDIEMLPRLQLTSDDVTWDPGTIFGNGYDDLNELYDYSDDYYIRGVMLLQDMINSHEINSLRAKGRDGKCSAAHLSKL